MPDITMCNGKFCSVYEKCYRNQAEPNCYQSYSDFSININESGNDFKPNYIKRQKDCEGFIKIFKKKGKR